MRTNRFTFPNLILFFLTLAAFAPLRAQDGLKDLASSKKVYIGNLISNAHLDNPETFRNGMADAHLLEEYNAVVLENYMKSSFILPGEEPENIHDLTVEELRATLTDENIEAFLSNEDWAGLRKRGHVMIWFTQAPQWLNEVGPTWTGQQVFSFARRYILALGQICGDRVDEWDVINEAISDDAPGGQRRWRPGTWYRRANDGSMTDWGEATYENFIKMLFTWAREAQPQARLHYNDYGIENFSDSPASKNRFMRDKFKALKDCGAPIDGIGFQSHFVLSQMVSSTGEINQGFIDGIEDSMEDLATAGLEVAVTELDIRVCNGDRDEDFQEEAFREYVAMALRQPNCHEVMIWGLRDEDNWITLRNDGPFMGCEDAVITEGDNYSPKPAYDGVAAALNSLMDQDDFGFAALNPGSGTTADCGGMGSLEPEVISIGGPVAVAPGGQVTVPVTYVSTGNQDIVLALQLDSDPFTLYTQTTVSVSEGTGTEDITLDVPMSVPPGDNQYRYQAYLTPTGEGIPGSVNNLVRSGITVLGEDSQLIISISGPETVGRGDTAAVEVTYSAVEGQEIVVWFQLDQSPFTTFQEFREEAATGLNTITAKLFIPLDVPIAEDAYQFQTILVPTGGGWTERISNVGQPNVDVEIGTSVGEFGENSIPLRAYPNPTEGWLTVELPPSSEESNYRIYSARGRLAREGTIGGASSRMRIDVAALPEGIYVLELQRGSERGVVRFIRR
ncbi:endo-1,4-beta-xylanase [Lewinella sp. W8]|uniref:endo-1,4-beta-xylanase n=1 Tax=Lewinella sp. W8 TaxID=2528208 RepID=UPI0010686F23|nr:endo-1,4-beta-xylanase [Lewinella sp. W8]MTB52099.1 T9SS type A sorting domain-containing protein [Lewinella sp. W8]